MRGSFLMLMGLSALLCACGEKSGEKTGEIAATDAMSRQEVKDEVDKVKLKPGQWEGRFAAKMIDMPGMPAGVKDQMQGMLSQNRLLYCVTPEEAANPSGEMFAGQENKNCAYGDFVVKDGNVKGHVSCDMPQGGKMNAVISGHYAPDNYAMDMDMDMAGGPKGMAMTMKAQSEGKWIGEKCAKAGSE